ncbi:MAG: proline--tRNA ligase [Candidatus Thermoplasmatota archaeon]|jgi:prolyl-tRNA synthetase|nr:proline--tRNA ligase [Candidatus Thermoplasmatota archaeon]
MPETKIKKTEDFNEWYNEIVELADLCDKRYPIKGMNVWRPYGWKLMTHVDQMIREEMDKTGHKEVCFPLLIPESLFKKEEEHIEGFGSEVYWVTHAGNNELEERWLLRPTSETAMYPIFSLWIRSHADLPLKTYQIVNTFRYETKQTRAFIRVREIHFFEAHTCHVDFEDAEKQIQEDKDIADRLFKKICLPYIFSKRPDWDKFAGAYYTISIDVLMPSGRTLQLGSIHQYRDNFSKPYDISYEAEDGKHKYCHQTTYGMSERILGALVGIHGDNKGLVLPPIVAPIQLVIIPVVFKGKEKEVTDACETLHKKLLQEKIRSHIDDRDITPGNKYYDWELKGVPLRVEIGPKDVEKKQIVIVRRDTGEKKVVPQDTAVKTIKEEFDLMSKKLYDTAKKLLDENMHRVKTVDEAKNMRGIVELPWCGNKDCALEIENVLEGNTLGEPIEKIKCEHPCPVCGKPAETWMRFAKSY